ncbi:MAG: PQQ-binding-like beta-propeller repeat protein [Myxococcaceae bacterium]
MRPPNGGHPALVMTAPSADVAIAPGSLLFAGQLVPSHPHPPLSITLVVTGHAGQQTAVQLPRSPNGDYEGTFSFTNVGTYHATLQVNGLTSATRTVTVAHPPSLSLSVEPAPARNDTWPRPEVWRRDETPHLRIDSDRPLATSSATLAGSANGVTPATSDGCEWAAPCDAGSCSCYSLQLNAPSLDALDGTLALSANGIDTDGIAGTTSGSLPTTRVRWVADAGAGATLAGSPAVTFDGYIVVNASNASWGSFVFSPDGVLLYAMNDPYQQQIEMSPSLVSFFYGTQQSSGWFGPVTLTDNLAHGRAYEISCLDGYAWHFCYDTGLDSYYGGPMYQTPAAWLSRWGSMFEIDASDYFGTPARLMGYSLYGFFGWELTGGISRVTPAAGIVTDEKNFYAIDGLGTVLGVHLGGTFSNESFDGVSFSSPALGEDVVSGQLLLQRPDGGQVLVRSVTGCDGGCPSVAAFAAPGTPSAPDWATSTGSAHGPVALDESAVFFTTDSPPQLVRVDHGSVVATASLPEPSTGSPVLGDNGLLYLLTSSGTLRVFDTATLAPRWSGTVGGLSAASLGSANLDCNRLGPDGGIATGSGSLYFFNGGALVSVIVDSPNLDPRAQWPKYQHDVQNTGNITQPRNAGCP